MSIQQDIFKQAKIEDLAEMLVGIAGQLNGNTEPTSYDGGAGAKTAVGDIMSEIIDRVQKDPALEKNPYLQPIVAALQGVNDVTNPREVAYALKSVNLDFLTEEPRPHPVMPRRNNPFAPK